MLLTVAVIELSDIAFAVGFHSLIHVKYAYEVFQISVNYTFRNTTYVSQVDSIPAVFGVTRDPFVVFTSNLFAILGNCFFSVHDFAGSGASQSSWK